MDITRIIENGIKEDVRDHVKLVQIANFNGFENEILNEIWNHLSKYEMIPLKEKYVEWFTFADITSLKLYICCHFEKNYDYKKEDNNILITTDCLKSILNFKAKNKSLRKIIKKIEILVYIFHEIERRRNLNNVYDMISKKDYEIELLTKDLNSLKDEYEILDQELIHLKIDYASLEITLDKIKNRTFWDRIKAVFNP